MDTIPRLQSSPSRLGNLFLLLLWEAGMILQWVSEVSDYAIVLD